MHHRHITAFLAASVASIATAQQLSIVPASAATADQNSISAIAGVHANGRSQILLDESAIGTINIGRPLESIAFRRDAGFAKPLVGGSCHWTICVSPSPNLAADASKTLDANLATAASARILALDGVVMIPPSTTASGRSVSWTDPQDFIRATFATPVVYTGGTLCIDIVGTQVAGNESPFWPIDAAELPLTGAVTSIGSPCDSIRQLTVAPADLVVGNSAPVSVRGPANVAAAFLIGAPIVGIDLSILGATGCALHVAPFASTPTAFDQIASIDTTGRGSAVLELKLPSEPQTLAAQVRIQLVSLTSPLQVSNAVDIAVAANAPQSGTAFVDAKTGSNEGRVSTTRVPTIALEFR